MHLTIEQKVGLFFILGIALLGVISFKVENASEWFKRQYEIFALFDHAAGMNAGDAVAVAGVKVGEIRNIELAENKKVRFTLRIEARTRLHEGAWGTIAWGGLMGNRYIDITPGDQDKPVLNEGATIETREGVELTKVLAKLNDAADEMRKTFRLEGDAGEKVRALIATLHKGADNLSEITSDIRNQKGTVGKLIGSDALYNDATDIAKDLKSTAARIDRIVAGNEKNLSAIIEGLAAAAPKAGDAFDALKKVGDDLNHGKGLLPALLNDEQMLKDFKNALAKLSSSLDKVEAVAKNVQEGKGIAGRLANDEQLANDLADAIKSLKNIAQRIDTGDNTLAKLTRDKDLYQDAKKLLDDARETLRSAREQVPVGTFASFLLTQF